MDDIERCSLEKFIPAKITTNTQNTRSLAEAEQSARLILLIKYNTILLFARSLCRRVEKKMKVPVREKTILYALLLPVFAVLVRLAILTSHYYLVWKKGSFWD